MRQDQPLQAGGNSRQLQPSEEDLSEGGGQTLKEPALLTEPKTKMSLCFESSAGTPAEDGAGAFLAPIFSVVVQVHVRAGERNEALYPCDANHENS